MPVLKSSQNNVVGFNLALVMQIGFNVEVGVPSYKTQSNKNACRLNFLSKSLLQFFHFLRYTKRDNSSEERNQRSERKRETDVFKNVR